MSLILAIEPDLRQSLTLTSLSRARLNVELVLGDTVGRAFDALGARRPDLVLTSPRLTANDESALASRVRVLEAGGAPIPRLVIPQLGSPPEKKNAKGARAKSHTASTRAHCDPLAFSEQISNCLEMVAAEQAALAAAQAELEAAWATDAGTRRPRGVTPKAPAVAAASPPHAHSMVEDPASGLDSGWEALSLEVAAGTNAAGRTIAEPPTSHLLALEPDVPTAIDVDLELFVLEIARVPAAPQPEELQSTVDGWVNQPEELIGPESVEAAGDPNETAADLLVGNETILPAILETNPKTFDVAEEVLATPAGLGRPLLEEPAAAGVAVPAGSASDNGSLLFERARQVEVEATLQAALADLDIKPAAASNLPGSSVAVDPTPAWQEVLSAIRRDIQHLRGDEPSARPIPATPRLDEIAAPTIATGAESSVTLSESSTEAEATPALTLNRVDEYRDPMPWRPKAKPKVTSRIVPVQDEWGFFDPQQCGFEALRAKLHEMIEKTASRQRTA